MTDTVTLTFGADLQNAALARSLAAAMAARVDLTVDRLEDVRLAVDEAVTETINAAAAGSLVSASFSCTDATLTVDVTASTERTEIPSPTSFGWTVLSALVDGAEAQIHEGRLTIRLHITRDAVDA